MAYSPIPCARVNNFYLCHYAYASRAKESSVLAVIPKRESRFIVAFVASLLIEMSFFLPASSLETQENPFYLHFISLLKNQNA